MPSDASYAIGRVHFGSLLDKSGFGLQLTKKKVFLLSRALVTPGCKNWPPNRVSLFGATPETGSFACFNLVENSDVFFSGLVEFSNERWLPASNMSSFVQRHKS